MSITLHVLMMLQAAPATGLALNEPPVIVVRARRAEDDLAACLARNCPPAEEMEAALDASVQQFADGRYVDAKRNLTSAISRNRRHAQENPRLFASLLATSATVADHEGDNRLYRRMTFERSRFLREELGDTDIETIVADLDTGDMQFELGNINGAVSYYRRAQEAAERSGRARIAAAAIFRQAWIELGRERYGGAQRLAARAIEVAGADDQMIAELVRILSIRVAFAKDDEEGLERQLAEIQAMNRSAPVLLTAPEIGPLGPLGSSSRPDAGSIAFVDIGFWVRPDGSTAEIEVLRENGRAAWFNPVVRQIGGRRYAPFRAEEGDPGSYQIERYTLRPTFDVPIGSRIVQRVGPYELRVASLTHMAEDQPRTANDVVQ